MPGGIQVFVLNVTGPLSARIVTAGKALPWILEINMTFILRISCHLTAGQHGGTSLPVQYAMKRGQPPVA